MNFKQPKTFTLIEMLIVIVIIGILAAALVPRLQAIQGRARDSQRKIDLRNLVTAAQIYKVDTNKFPRAGTCGASDTSYDASECFIFSIASPTTFLIQLSGYMTKVPLDPINDSLDGSGPEPWASEPTYGYAYGHVLSGASTFSIISKLENPSDPDRCEVKSYPFPAGYCNVGSYPVHKRFYIVTRFSISSPF